MFLWYPVMDLARAPRRTARKKGSGYENDVQAVKNESQLKYSNAAEAPLCENILKRRKRMAMRVYQLIN
jgi:hypothetical protein